MNSHISFLQTIGIVLVVVGHAFFGSGETFLCRWIYTFHMPLFFFISGYLLEYTTRRKGTHIANLSFADFVRNKSRRLLVPYLVWSTLVFLPKSVLAKYSVRPIDATFGGYIDMMVHPYKNVIGSFWFLPTLFLVFLAVVVMFKAADRWLCKYYGKLNVALIVSFVVSVFTFYDFEQFLNIEGVVYYIFYFLLGIWCCRNKPLGTMSKPMPVFLLSLAFSFVVVYYIPLCNIHIIGAVNGIVMCSAASCVYVNAKARFLNHLYGATFTIYIYHWFVQVVCFQFMLNLLHIPMWVASTIAVVGGIYFPLFIYRFLKTRKNRWRYIAMISGL